MNNRDISRIENKKLHSKITTAEEAAKLIKSNMVIGCSGFTTAGFPKAVPKAIAKLEQAKNLTLITSASTGDELDGELSRSRLLSHRFSFQSNKDLRTSINTGLVEFEDFHLSRVSDCITSGKIGKIDYAIIECCMITKDCGIVPMPTVGISDTLIKYAERIILEVNCTCPTKLYGMHDIVRVSYGDIIPIRKPGDRIGLPYIQCDPDKISAIVFTDEIGSTPAFKEPDYISRQIASNIVKLLKSEIAEGRLPSNLPPLQSGVGSVGNAVFSELKSSGFTNLTMYTEVIQESALSLIKDGIITMASTTSLSLSENGLNELYGNIDYYRDKVIIRPQTISNHPEPIRRLGVIAINTAAEIDIYGNINSSHATGSSIINGIGGSGDFSRNSRLSIFMTPSIGKKGDITRIVPMVSHVDNPEHDVDIVVTENGYADLRGKSPKEKAQLIINNCCHPDYKPYLLSYYQDALLTASGMHTPHNLNKVFDLHKKYISTGRMTD